jgi:hypothetical protein
MDGSIAYQNIHISTTLQSPSPYDKICEHPSQYSGFSTIFSWIVLHATRVNLKIFKTKTIVVGSLLVLVLLKPL